MNVSSASLSNVLTGAVNAQNIQAQIAVAVLKQIQDQQAREVQALLKMMQAAPTLDGTGQIVNISA